MSQKDPDSTTQKENIYHAIGEFMVAFSQLIHMAELMTCQAFVSKDKPNGFSMAYAVLSGRCAQDTIDSFFSLCVEMRKNDWDIEDSKIIDVLRKEIQTIIQDRNRIAHDLWTVGRPYRDPPEGFDAVMVKLFRSPKKGYQHEEKPIAISLLKTQTESMLRIKTIVSMLGAMICFNDAGTPKQKYIVENGNKVIEIPSQ